MAVVVRYVIVGVREYFNNFIVVFRTGFLFCERSEGSGVTSSTSVGPSGVSLRLAVVVIGSGTHSPSGEGWGVRSE